MNSTTNALGETKQLLAEEVFRHIASRIIDGDFAPGHRIRDVDVADELHVSRTPVREALQRLERLGLVIMYPSRFTEVTIVTPEIVDQTREFAGYQAGIAARMAVPRLTQPQREQVAALVDEMQPALGDAALTSRTRWAVFSYLSDHSDNSQHRVQVQDAAMALFRNLRDWTVPEEDHARMTTIYRDFREAVLGGDGDRAEALARQMYYV